MFSPAQNRDKLSIDGRSLLLERIGSNEINKISEIEIENEIEDERENKDLE